MSIRINDTYIKTNCVGEPEVIIGDSYFTMEEFCDIVKYVMVNTDLKDNDPRVDLLADYMAKLYCEKGYNKGNIRLELRKEDHDV